MHLQAGGRFGGPARRVLQFSASFLSAAGQNGGEGSGGRAGRRAAEKGLAECVPGAGFKWPGGSGGKGSSTPGALRSGCSSTAPNSSIIAALAAAHVQIASANKGFVVGAPDWAASHARFRATFALARWR